jgi:hypothetical protein
MSSVIEGYNYDIFISFLLEDNYDDWITESDKSSESKFSNSIT